MFNDLANSFGESAGQMVGQQLIQKLGLVQQPEIQPDIVLSVNPETRIQQKHLIAEMEKQDYILAKKQYDEKAVNRKILAGGIVLLIFLIWQSTQKKGNGSSVRARAGSYQ